MPLQRRDIRLATIAALTGGDAAPYATMAQDRVFDSRQDAYLHFQNRDVSPCIAVYTDGVEYRPINGALGAPYPMQTFCDLVIEMSLTGFSPDLSIDSAMEARLDLFESQVFEALFSTQRLYAEAWQTTFKRIHGIQSERLANAEHNTRIAQRDLVMKVEYDQRCLSLADAFPNLTELRFVATLNGEDIATGTVP